MASLLAKMKRRLQTLAQTKAERRHALVGPAELWKMKRDFQIRFLTEMGLRPDHYLFEIGCGTLRGGLPLVGHLEEGHYFGADVRSEVLAEARQELKDAGLENKAPTLLHSPDISQLSVDRRFDVIWAFSVLFHMNDAILDGALDFVARHLDKNGVFYANVDIGAEGEGEWMGFPVVRRPWEFYSAACLRAGLVPTDLGPLKDLGHVSKVAHQDNQRMLKISSTLHGPMQS